MIKCKSGCKSKDIKIKKPTSKKIESNRAGMIKRAERKDN